MILRRRSAHALTLAIASLVACEPANGVSTCEPSDISRVRRGFAVDPASVIIYFTRDVDVPRLAASGRAGRRSLIEALHRDALRAQRGTLALLRGHGVEPAARLWMINAVAATVPRALLDEIARLPEVDRIEPDLAIRAPITSTSSNAATTAWNLSAIRAPDLWTSGQRGAGVVVAVLDSGVDAAHPDLAASWRSSAGWYDPYDQHAAPYDGSGHGTQVTGLVIGGDASGEPIGVAPEARWIAARIYDDAGVASLGKIHLALQWVLDPDGDPTTDDAADIVTASWGYSERVDECFLEFEPDLAALRAAQIATVFAAGNTGPSSASSISPANNPSAFAAGAVDESLTVTANSGRGPDACTGAMFPELVAPGENVRTADRTFGGQFPDSYVFVTGTSFAAPHVAGALALLRGAHPSATVKQLEDALTTTAVDLVPAGADNASGFGLPDLLAAEARLSNLITMPSCTDADADGSFVEPGCGGPLDCNDDDATIHPDACDVASDNLDQDCDGADRIAGACC